MVKTTTPEQAPSPSPSPPVAVAYVKKPDSILRLAKDWHVDTVPPSSSIKGTIIPKFLNHQRRRIAVEVYRFYDSDDIAKEKKGGKGAEHGYYEECFIRILEPVSALEKKASRKIKKDAKKSASDGASVMPASVMNGDMDDDMSILGGGGFDNDIMDMPTPSYDGWSEKYKFPLSAVSIQRRHHKNLHILFEFRGLKQSRTIYFDSEEDAEDAENFIKDQKEKDKERKAHRFANNASGMKVKAEETLELLVEIVGATNLPAGDMYSSDPYVLCWFNHKLVHQTHHIPKTLEPIWTLKTKGLFLLTMSAKELFEGDGLHFDVMDFDAVGKNERLGFCKFEPRAMHTSKGERVALPLEGEEAKGHLHIRIRPATANDRNFMNGYLMAGNNPKGDAALDKLLKQANDNKGGKNMVASIISRNEKMEKSATGPPVKKYRVRPGPDPKREKETEWLTKEEMDKEMMSDSREWVDAGSGHLGRLFVEILQCNDLPNLDVGGFAGNKTDAFCCLVFEDVWAQTDIIDDDLSPQWMPWTKRAFIFHMFHSSSALYIGAFDNDGAGDHDLIGRVAVNVSNLQPDTMYVLNYDLYPSGKHTLRESKGQITIRLRMEIDDDRKLLLSCLDPPKIIYVNVKTRKDFNVIEKVCNGGFDMDTYNLKTIFTYLDELQSYKTSLLYIEEAMITLLFWRGHHEVSVFGKKFLIPLHSFNLFLSTIFLVEYPQLIPSFSFACIAWVMLATMFFRCQNPNPWHRSKSFFDIFVALAYGDSFPPASIAVSQNSDEIKKYEQYWSSKIEAAAKASEEAAKEAVVDQEEQEAFLAELGDTNTDISSKKRKLIPISVDLLKPYMEPFQAYLAIACRMVRYVRNIVIWEEPYLSFWLTLGCMVLSVACMFVPWFFLIKWTSRIVVWSICGPWMKFVDIYYWTPMENMTEMEIQAAKLKRKEFRQKMFAEQAEKARIERERATKLRTMKKYLFGKFIMKVPVLKEDRWQDIPLPQSSATPYTAKPLALAEVAMKEAGYHRIRIPGQQLEGDMIPTMESQSFTDAPTGQATKMHSQKETDTAAYAKVGSIVAGAAVITYYAVPIVSHFFSSLA